MNKFMNAVRGLNTRAAKIAVGLTVGTSAALAIAGTSGAVTLEEQFTSAQTSVLSELGLGATLLIAVTLFVVGITVLVKWLKKGAKQTAG